MKSKYIKESNEAVGSDSILTLQSIYQIVFKLRCGISSFTPLPVHLHDAKTLVEPKIFVRCSFGKPGWIIRISLLLRTGIRNYVKILIHLNIWSEIFPHDYACASSLIFKKNKLSYTIILKLTTFFFSNTRDVYRKLSTFSESSVKVKVTLYIFRNFAHVGSYLQTKTCTEAILCKIIETTNAMTLTKTILESAFKVPQSSWKITTLKRPVQFSKEVPF